MSAKSNLVSKVLFVLSSVMFLVFAVSVFVGGKVVAGAVYFLYFAILLAFSFLDRKYNSVFMNMYRYSAYLGDLLNVFAVAFIIYHKTHLGLMISVLCLQCVSFLIDLFAKNRKERRRLESVLVGFFNCALMLIIFPYFFYNNLSIGFAITAIIVSTLLVVLKIILAVVPYKGKIEEENEFLEEKVADGKNDDHDIQ